MATESKRNPDSPARRSGGSSRRVKKTDARPTPRGIAEESAAIYPDTFSTPPSPEEIAREAYSIYCERGCEQGRELDDWLEAERRLSEQWMSKQRQEERR